MNHTTLAGKATHSDMPAGSLAPSGALISELEHRGVSVGLPDAARPPNSSAPHLLSEPGTLSHLQQGSPNLRSRCGSFTPRSTLLAHSLTQVTTRTQQTLRSQPVHHCHHEHGSCGRVRLVDSRPVQRVATEGTIYERTPLRGCSRSGAQEASALGWLPLL